MSDISIKMKICERLYPMKIRASEESKIREAGKLLNERIERYLNKYAASDKQDLLAMVAFDYAIENLSITRSKANTAMAHGVEAMISLIDSRMASA